MAQCGFTAILFEAAIYDFIGLERAAETRTAAQEQLDNTIGRFWWTRELTPWRRALFEAATRQRVVVGGLDDQVSITSHYAEAALPRLIAAAFSESTATECRQTLSRHVGWTYDAKNPFDERELLRLQQCARNAADARRCMPRVNAALSQRCRWVRGSSRDGAIESAPSDLPLMQVTHQGPGGPRAQSLTRRRNRWKPRRRAHQRWK